MSVEKYKPYIDTLKSKMQTVENFADAWNYFFDHLGENPAFLREGKRIEDEMLKFLIVQSVKSAGKGATNITQCMFVEVGGNFVHGPVIIGPNMVNLLYFRDINMGMLAIVSLTKKTRETHFVRITASIVQGGSKDAAPFNPPAGKKPN